MNKISSFLAIAFSISAGVSVTETPKMHQQAATAHEMMNNSDAPAHQQMAQAHAAQANNSSLTSTNAKSFPQMNEHKKAVVVHQSVNNGHPFAYEVQAEQHRAQISTQGQRRTILTTASTDTRSLNTVDYSPHAGPFIYKPAPHFIVNVSINNSLNPSSKSKYILALYPDCIKQANKQLITLRITALIALS